MKLFKQQEAQSIVVQVKALVCPHCGHDRFWNKKVLLNSSISAFFGFDWADRSADCFACEQCGRLEWFVRGLGVGLATNNGEECLVG